MTPEREPAWKGAASWICRSKGRPRFGHVHPGHPSCEQFFMCCWGAASIPGATQGSWAEQEVGRAGLLQPAPGTVPRESMLLGREAKQAHDTSLPPAPSADSQILLEERQCPSQAAAPAISAPCRAPCPCAVLVQEPPQSTVLVGHPKISISFPRKGKPVACGCPRDGQRKRRRVRWEGCLQQGQK